MSGSLSLGPAPTTALLNATRADISTTLGTAKAAARSMKSAQEIAKAESTARDFEAVFAAEMLKPMFEDISTDGMFGGGKGEEVFRSLLLDEYGKMIAQTGGIGLAAQVKEQMILMQEQADHGTQNAQH